jgi:hypothetical protein
VQEERCLVRVLGGHGGEWWDEEGQHDHSVREEMRDRGSRVEWIARGLEAYGLGMLKLQLWFPPLRSIQCSVGA